MRLTRGSSLRGPDGRVLVQDYRQSGPDGAPLFALHAVFVADPETGEVLLWGFDSAGFPPEPARSRFAGGGISLTRSSPRGEARIRLEDDGAGGWRHERDFRPPGGDWLPLLRGRMRPRASRGA